MHHQAWCAFAIALLLLPVLTPKAHAELLEEVLVTAGKVEQQAQAVPASLQVLSGEMLDALDLTRLYELQFAVPGLVVNNIGMFGARFTLRGVSNEAGTGLSIANHVNGAYLDSANLAITRAFDMERVEVLKGPQGTLYGRNATGGSINFVTRPAVDQWDAGIEAAYGSFDTARLEGHVNLPFEAAALRIAFIGSDGDGYVRNAVDGREFGEADFWGLRTSMAFDPTEDLHIDAMAQRVVDDGAAGELWTPNLAYLPDPNDIHLTRVTQDDPYLDTKNDVFTTNVEYQLDWATVNSVSAYARSEVHNVDDCAGSPRLAGCVRSVSPLHSEQWSQELRLASPADAAIEWLGGVYWFDGSRNTDFRLYAPVLNPDPLDDYTATTEETAYAAFGQVAVPLGEHWTVTTGLRFSKEDHRVAQFGTGVRDAGELLRAADHWDDSSWRLAIAYAPTANVLTYASAATGFKSGGITTDLLPTGEFDSYAPEDLLAYEAGVRLRSATGNWNLHAAAFHCDFNDMQVPTTVVLSDEVVSVIDNAAEVEIQGVDATASVRLAENLTASGGVVWMPKRKFVEFYSETAGDVSGNEIGRAPQWTSTTSVECALPVSNLGRITATLHYSYRSSFYFTKENLLTERQGSFGLLGLNLSYTPTSEGWYVFVSGRNLTDADYFHQAFIQSSPGYPATWEAGFGVRFD